MNNLPRQMLRRILDKYGKEIGSDAKRCEGLLNDLCGAYRREINVLVNAIEERIPLDLLAGSSSMPLELLLNRLEKRLEDQTGLTADAARWAVESWALALGAATNAQIEERARKNSSLPPTAKTETNAPTETENKSSNPNIANINRNNPVLAPQKRQAPMPPVNRQPARIPHSPPVHLPKNNQPPMQVPKANPQIQPSNPPAIVKSRFGIFRGCLIVVFLLIVSTIVLFLGVPYALEVMRETQRERGAEPPRFPVR
jgi:hypothetical protein